MDFSNIKSAEDQRDVAAAAMMRVQSSSSSSSSQPSLIQGANANANANAVLEISSYQANRQPKISPQQSSSSSSSSSSNIDFVVLQATEDTIDRSLLREGAVGGTTNGRATSLSTADAMVTPPIPPILSPRNNKHTSGQQKNNLPLKVVPVVDSLSRVVPDLQVALAKATQPDDVHVDMACDESHNTSLDVSHHTDISSGGGHSNTSRDVSREEMETIKLFVRDQLGDSAYRTGMTFLKTMVCNVDMEDDEKLILEMEEIVGADGLQYLDHMFKIINTEERLEIST